MSRLIDKGTLKSVIRNEFPDLGDRIRINNIINEQPTIDAVERIEYEKMKDLAEQYKFEYECIFEAHKEVLNEVLPNRVEVVRCENCKWCYDGYCSRFDDLIPFGHENYEWRTFFCSYGERREER